MRKVAVSVSLAAISVVFARLLFWPLVVSGRAEGASGLLLVTGAFTIAVAAVVSK